MAKNQEMEANKQAAMAKEQTQIAAEKAAEALRQHELAEALSKQLEACKSSK